MSAWGSLLLEGARWAVKAGAAALRRARRKQEAADAWAGQPAPMNGCRRCGEIAYTPDQHVCFKCGWPL